MAKKTIAGLEAQLADYRQLLKEKEEHNEKLRMDRHRAEEQCEKLSKELATAIRRIEVDQAAIDEVQQNHMVVLGQIETHKAILEEVLNRAIPDR